MSMKITIESTAAITDIEGVPVRLWKGVTAEGTPCLVFVHRVAVHEDEDVARFERELREQVPPGVQTPLAGILAAKPTAARAGDEYEF